MQWNETAKDGGVRFLRLKKVVTLAELILRLHCSRRTVQRRLKEWQAINSYNHNGGYYTLPDIPQFDASGLWNCREARFSRHGNLPQTVVQLVHDAPAGLTAAELGERLGLRPGSFLWNFRAHPELKREKHHGVYVYFASQPAVYAGQRQRRSLPRSSKREPTDTEAVAILVEQIKHPAIGFEELCRRLRMKKLPVTPDMVASFFARHGLSVKKTRHLP